MLRTSASVPSAGDDRTVVASAAVALADPLPKIGICEPRAASCEMVPLTVTVVLALAWSARLSRLPVSTLFLLFVCVGTVSVLGAVVRESTVDRRAVLPASTGHAGAGVSACGRVGMVFTLAGLVSAERHRSYLM